MTNRNLGEILHSQKSRGTRRQTFVEMLFVEESFAGSALLQELKQTVLSKSTAHRRERIKKKKKNPGTKERGEMDLHRGMNEVP